MFKETMAGRTTDHKSHGYSGTFFEGLIDDPLFAAAFGEQQYGSGFTTAVRDDKGEIVGVITNRANTRCFETDIADVLQGYRDVKVNSPVIRVIDSKGLIIFEHAASDPKEIDHEVTTLLKRNLVSENYGPALASSRGESGTMEDKDAKGDLLTVGYDRIDNIKWPKELGWSVFGHDLTK